MKPPRNSTITILNQDERHNLADFSQVTAGTHSASNTPNRADVAQNKLIQGNRDVWFISPYSPDQETLSDHKSKWF